MSVNFCGINISYSVQCGCAVKISWLTLVILMPKGCWVHVNIFTRYTQSLTLCICPSARPLVIICLFLELHHETVVLAASMFLDSPAAGTRYLYCFVLFPWHLDNSATSWRHVFSVRSVVSHCCDCLDRKICALYIFRTELTILTARVSIGQLVACWYSDDGNKSVIGFVTNCTVNTHWCSLFFQLLTDWPGIGALHTTTMTLQHEYPENICEETGIGIGREYINILCHFLVEKFRQEIVKKEEVCAIF